MTERGTLLYKSKVDITESSRENGYEIEKTYMPSLSS